MGVGKLIAEVFFFGNGVLKLLFCFLFCCEFIFRGFSGTLDFFGGMSVLSCKMQCIQRAKLVKIESSYDNSHVKKL